MSENNVFFIMMMNYKKALMVNPHVCTVFAKIIVKKRQQAESSLYYCYSCYTVLVAITACKNYFRHILTPWLMIKILRWQEIIILIQFFYRKTEINFFYFFLIE